MASLFGDTDALATTSSTRAGTAAAVLAADTGASSLSGLQAGSTAQAQLIEALFAPAASLLSGASSSAGTASSGTGNPYDWYSDISSKAA